jgi:hypothetical protein
MQHRYEQLDERERAELAAFIDPQLERAAETLKAVVLFSARSTQQAPQK